MLDITGETSELGKPAGNDLRQGTLTLPVLYFLENTAGRPQDRLLIASVVAGTASEDEIDKALMLIRDSGVWNGP